MPSKKERKVFGIALAAKRGEHPVESLRGAAKHLFKTMSEKELASYVEAKPPTPAKTSAKPTYKRQARSW